jgi:hypothetical protein
MKRTLVLFAMMLLLAASSFSQKGGKNTTWIIPITFSNPGFSSWVDSFGIGIGYTKCIDNTSGLPYPEIELPDIPPSGIAEARFIDFSGFDPDAGCHGEGLMLDVHTGSYTSSSVDTFQYQFQVGDKNVPWYITWDTTNIHRKLSSLVMLDAGTGGLLLNLDMTTTDSITFTNASTLKNSVQFYIYAVWKPIDSSLIMGTEDPMVGKTLPTKINLRQNYPNPFNPGTLIEYDLPSREYVSLRVYNMLGQEVAVLVNGEQEPGYKSVKFETASAAGGLPSGVYIYRIMAGIFSDTKKMLLVR